MLVLYMAYNYICTVQTDCITNSWASGDNMKSDIKQKSSNNYDFNRNIFTTEKQKNPTKILMETKQCNF